MEFERVLKKNSVVYSHELHTRFSDFDIYGHVTASKYLEFVSSSRWLFLEKAFQMSPASFVDKNLGFYLSSSQVHFLKPIDKPQTISVESFAVKRSFTSIETNFEIRSKHKETLFSNGSFQLVCMNLNKQKPQKIPEWAFKYFFTPA